MARIRWNLPVASAALVALTIASAAAQAPKDKPAAQPSAEEMAMMAAGAPGPQHKQLEVMVGKWNCTVKMFPAPGAPPQVSKGVSTNDMALGGRFLHQAFTGEFMGMPFTGMGLTGYDNLRKQYVGTWVDTMSTGVMYTLGSASADGKTIEFKGDMPGPDGKIGPVRNVVKIVSDKQHVFEMYMPGPDGKEMKMMEITYDKAM